MLALGRTPFTEHDRFDGKRRFQERLRCRFIQSRELGVIGKAVHSDQRELCLWTVVYRMPAQDSAFAAGTEKPRIAAGLI